MQQIIPVDANENVHFNCTRCGDCCRHVKLAVMLESLDVYRLAQHLHKNTENILMDYAEPQLLDECGYPIFLLKTVGADDACIFLKADRCTVYPARPKQITNMTDLKGVVKYCDFCFKIAGAAPQQRLDPSAVGEPHWSEAGNGQRI